MLSFNAKVIKSKENSQPVIELILKMVEDLENTREKYHGYSYVRTMRNILVGKEDAAIAPYFKGKEYYGICDNLELDALEKMLDIFVETNQLKIIYTDHGKLYCTHEYHDKLCRRKYLN